LISGGAVAAQPGQAQRDLQLQAFYQYRGDQQWLSLDAFNYSGAALPNTLAF